MKKNDKTKITVLVVLIILVLGLGIGYSSFSSLLSIEPKTKVRPVDNFNVRLSSNSTSFVSGSIEANKTQMAASTEGYGDEYGATATISEDGKELTNINAYFTKPGQSVIYSLYAVNSVGYDAYLDAVTFTPAQTKCSIPTGSTATSSLVQAACDNVKISIKVGDEPFWTEEDNTSDIMHHKILASPNETNLNSEPIQVKVEYVGKKVADDRFSVDLGSIRLDYTTNVKE